MNGKKISIHICASAIAMVLVWCVRTFAYVDIPAEIGIAIGTIVAMLLIVILPDRLIAEEDGKQGGFVLVQLLPALFFVGCLALLVSCGGQMTVHPVSQENVALSPAKATQNLIDETNAGLTAAYTTVLNGLQSGAMTKSEAATYQASLDKASEALDAGTVFLGKGDITSAQGQIQIAQSILSLAQSKLIELKQKGK